MTNTLLTKTALSLGLVGALAVTAATPSLAWTQRNRVHHSAAAAAVGGAVAGVGLAAGTALGTAAALGYGPYPAAYGYEPYGPGAYAYAPGLEYGPAYAAAPGYPIGGAYAYVPGYAQGPVGYNSDGGAIDWNQLGPGCPLGLKMDDRC
ncbi:MAG TPA: hypothetical protein VHA77_10270 [Xanthobacteraceae bacterium]|jgi:hypothetical protein|nr:hypothetical protein [Xanthobacteraceae bacterium]